MSDQENKTNEELGASDSIIEVEWEEAKEIFEIRSALMEVESTLSSMLLNFEKKKAAFLHRARELETSMYAAGSNLRDQKKINQELTYELKLPTTHGEKAYFIKKDI
jgi:hypothetical protein